MVIKPDNICGTIPRACYYQGSFLVETKHQACWICRWFGVSLVEPKILWGIFYYFNTPFCISCYITLCIVNKCIIGKAFFLWAKVCLWLPLLVRILLGTLYTAVKSVLTESQTPLFSRRVQDFCFQSQTCLSHC